MKRSIGTAASISVDTLMKRLLIGLIVLVGAFTTATSLVMAHSTSRSLSGRGYGIVNSSHTYVTACDNRADGWGVRTIYRLRSGVNGLVGDANGSAAGCGSRSVTTSSNPVVSYRVCAGPSGTGENSECTAWTAPYT